MLVFSRGWANSVAAAHKLSFSPQWLFQMHSFHCFPPDSWYNCHFMVFVMQTPVKMIYLHFLCNGLQANSIPPLLFVCVCVCGVFCVCVCLWFVTVCLRVFLWAWWVCCLTPLPSQSCLYLCSCVSSPQLAPLCCSGLKSAAVPDRLIAKVQAFSGVFFQTLCCGRELKRAKDSGERGLDRRAEGKTRFVCWLTGIPCPVFVWQGLRRRLRWALQDGRPQRSFRSRPPRHSTSNGWHSCASWANSR